MEFIDKIIHLDKEALLFLNSFHNDFWDLLMFFITRKETWIPFYLILLFYIIRTYRNKSILVVIMLSLTVLATDQISFQLKELIMRLRPLYDPEIMDQVHIFGKKSGLYGYFSSHAANSFGILTFTTYLFKNKTYKRSVFVWAILVSYSRIYLGVHFPLDILTGALFGYLMGYLFYRLLMFIENHFFIARQPAIKTAKLYIKDSLVVLLVLAVTYAILISCTHILLYYQLV